MTMQVLRYLKGKWNEHGSIRCVEYDPGGVEIEECMHGTWIPRKWSVRARTNASSVEYNAARLPEATNRVKNQLDWFKDDDLDPTTQELLTCILVDQAASYFHVAPLELKKTIEQTS